LPQADASQGNKEQKTVQDKLRKAIVQVRHDDRQARLMLDRRPTAEGWAWLKYEDDGQEFEADLGTVQLVALLGG
jgi:ParB family chromosome partitioning protein